MAYGKDKRQKSKVLEINMRKTARQKTGWNQPVFLVRTDINSYRVLHNVYEAVRVICGCLAGRGTLYRLQ
jgi:hypothetical protein